jgi:hypothetical protein
MRKSANLQGGINDTNAAIAALSSSTKGRLFTGGLIASNATSEGRALNHRVEIALLPITKEE